MSSRSLSGATCHVSWTLRQCNAVLAALRTEFPGIFMSFYKYISVNTEDRWRETRLLLLLLSDEIEGFEGEGACGFLCAGVLDGTSTRALCPASSGSALVAPLRAPAPHLQEEGAVPGGPRGLSRPSVSVPCLEQEEGVVDAGMY